ncbi:hypothetical protein CEXT_109121, partial [Caerostris extrusa]
FKMVWSRVEVDDDVDVLRWSYFLVNPIFP